MSETALGNQSLEWLGYGKYDRRTLFRFLAAEGDFSRLQSVQSGSGLQLATYLIGSWDF